MIHLTRQRRLRRSAWAVLSELKDQMSLASAQGCHHLPRIGWRWGMWTYWMTGCEQADWWLRPWNQDEGSDVPFPLHLLTSPLKTSMQLAVFQLSFSWQVAEVLSRTAEEAAAPWLEDECINCSGVIDGLKGDTINWAWFDGCHWQPFQIQSSVCSFQSLSQVAIVVLN